MAQYYFLLQETLANNVAVVLILKPDTFWERRKSGHLSKQDLTNYPFNVSQQQLHNFFSVVKVLELKGAEVQCR